MKKSFWFWLCFVISILLAVYFSVKIILTSMGYGGSAIIKTISISSDSGNKNLSRIASVIGIAPGTRVYSIRLEDINNRVMNIPDVKKSAVRRLPNGNLSVMVQLHHAIALWTDGQHIYPLSSDGTVIHSPIANRPDNTVMFRGPLPADITEITKLAHNITNHLDYMEWIENRRWNIHTKNNITVMLSETNPVAAISALIIMDKNHQILSKKINTLDMRDPGRVLVK